jgi:tetratricopeptide (TPR) repeat protein
MQSSPDSTGLPHCRLAQRLDPNEDQMAFPLMLAHDYDGSIAMLQMWLRRDTENGLFHCYLFANYNKKEMYKEGIQELSQCFSLFGYQEAAARMQRAFTISGYRGAIRQWTQELEHLQQTKQAYLPGNLAGAYTILGDKDRAFYWLEQAYEHREMVSVDGGVFFLGSDPMYA